MDNIFLLSMLDLKKGTFFEVIFSIRFKIIAELLLKSSMITTLYPFSINVMAVWLPIYPRPPVNRIVPFDLCMKFFLVSILLRKKGGNCQQ